MWANDGFAQPRPPIGHGVIEQSVQGAIYADHRRDPQQLVLRQGAAPFANPDTVPDRAETPARAAPSARVRRQAHARVRSAAMVVGVRRTRPASDATASGWVGRARGGGSF